MADSFFTGDEEYVVPSSLSLPEQFVVIWERDPGDPYPSRITLENGKWVSDAYDLADCDYMEGVKEILALDEHGKLVPVSLGEQEQINTDQENPFRYARSPIMAGTRIAGYVTWTDH